MQKPILGYGLCECGCGQKTTVSGYNFAPSGYVKGQPRRYMLGHRYNTGPVAFWSNVPDHLPVSQCWEWQGHRDKHGYGYFHGIVTRIMWVHAHGSIDPGLKVCHSCDNPPCVNPAHLFLGTQKDNIHDMCRKGRAWWQQDNQAATERWTQ
jgi:hypothetical protein